MSRHRDTRSNWLNDKRRAQQAGASVVTLLHEKRDRESVASRQDSTPPAANGPISTVDDQTRERWDDALRSALHWLRIGNRDAPPERLREVSNTLVQISAWVGRGSFYAVRERGGSEQKELFADVPS